jgi:hypothetical protein
MTFAAKDNEAHAHVMTPENEPIADRPLTEPAESRLPTDNLYRLEILAVHAAAMDASDPGYLDPQTGLFVLTASFLASQGACCKSGCRHCPFITDDSAG